MPTDLTNCDWPIIYVRGYAMSRDEIDDTTADPFCGFNLGSTVMRAQPDKDQPPKKFIFESPVVRLQSDFGYGDVYEDGVDPDDPDWRGSLRGEKGAGGIPRRSIIIYRYYDEASTLLGTGKTPKIERFAEGLSELILKTRSRVCSVPQNRTKPEQFRCYLVAHSMGGLVCRAFLQNRALGSDAARKHVDKFFTYATPHNGIELSGVNVPSWLSASDINNFNRARMAEYLALSTQFEATKRVDWMPESQFDSRRIFCMIGTNRLDYEAAAGLSRTFVGHGSDGLVRVENASVWGIDDAGKVSQPCATAYTYRSHSGRYGIVNSEEAYQNLVRFLFGDVRVDMWLDIEDVRVPEKLEADDDAGRLDALYQIELTAAPRGKRWYLTRRTTEEDSVACRRHADLRDPEKPDAKHVYLSTVFLANRWRVNPRMRSLAYGMVIGVRIPDYEVNRKFWPNSHFEGQYLLRDALTLEIVPPMTERGAWKVKYGWESSDAAQAYKEVEVKKLDQGRVEVSIPFATNDKHPPRSPGISGQIRFVVSAWNQKTRGRR